MTRTFISVLLLLIIHLQVKAQSLIGLQTGYGDVMGLYHDFLVETSLCKNFSLSSSVTGALNRGVGFRTGIRYKIPVFSSANIRLGLDAGSFLEFDKSNEGFKKAYFLSGINIGIHYQFSKKWGILAECNWMSFTYENRRIIGGFPQLGVTYSWGK